MKNLGKKAISSAVVASLLITSSATAINVKAATVTPPESPRLWGADRYETAVKVSQAGWTSTSDYAIIASGQGYADALCAAPLAKANNAPILLTEKNSISQSTLDELKRLKVKYVYVIGGEGVVSETIVNKIKAEITTSVERFGGLDRYATSVKVAEKIGVQDKVVLASGEGYADALSAAPVAAIKGMPILLTESKKLSEPTANYIKANSGITKTYIIGGYASVSEDTMGKVPSPERFGGVDRYETNAKVIEGFKGDFDFKNVYIALGDGPKGDEFADALTGSALAGKNKSPLVITGKDLSGYTKNLIKSTLNASSTITVLGGKANVSDELLDEMKKEIPTAPSTGGGGGGGSSSGGDNYTDITSIAKLAVQKEFNDQLKKNSSLTNYIKLDTTGDVVKVQLQKENMESLKDIFETGKNQDPVVLRARLDKVQEQINHFKTISSLEIGGDSLTDILSKADSVYFDTNGNLNKTLIVEKIQNSSLSYEKFQGELKTKLTNELNERYIDTTTKVPELKISGIAVTKVQQNGVDIYSTDLTRAQIVDKVVNLLDVNSTLGDYKIYSNNNYFNVNIDRN
ncbi:cell wall-binding repeat-containing protein [Clostridium sp. A1-XYC3]|uniref:Cell wall-binding repeat-containing protein n=1 Tax=Clostridium tanneri TaxID=3037988 RepID=A0ABU4JWV0_9CLOT|nr:cell wall-binding repeat-containing protein [Clostridium sp. A1-XYC3]MDW8802587.1 cell wall-binding repeat-containing protein [Clostridium sp. A1-XYC3]